MTKNADNSDLVELTAEIVSSYVANNNVPVSEVGAFIREVFQSLSAQVSGDTQQDAPRQEPLKKLSETI